jgi:hypothetical protein
VRPLYAHWNATATTRVRKKLRRGDLGPPKPGFLSPLESTDWPAASTVSVSNRSGVTRPRDPRRGATGKPRRPFSRKQEEFEMDVMRRERRSDVR